MEDFCQIKVEWQKINIIQEDNFSPRTGHSITFLKPYIYLFGGTDDRHRRNDFYKFNTENVNNNTKWDHIQQSGNIPSPRSSSQMISINNQLILFGGYTRKHGDYFNDLFEFNPSNNIWTQLNPKFSPEPRSDFIFIQYCQKCYIFGGADSFRKFNDIIELNEKRNEFKKIQFQPNQQQPSPRFGHSGSVFQNYLLIFGGWDGYQTLNDLWKFDFNNQKQQFDQKIIQLQKIRWELINLNCQITSRYRHIQEIYQNFLYIYGGVDKQQERFDDLHRINLKNFECKRLVKNSNSNSPSPRTFHRSQMIDQYLYIIGGFDGQRLNDIYRINLNFSENQLKNQETQIIKQNYVQKEKNDQIFFFHDALIGEHNEFQKAFNSLIQCQFYKINYHQNNIMALSGHAMQIFNNNLYSLGGINNEGLIINNFSKYNIEENQWREINILSKPLISLQRFGVKCCKLDNKDILYYFGGAFSDKEYSNDLFCYEINKNQFNLLPQSVLSKFSLPNQKIDHSLIGFNNFLYAYGGRTSNNKILGEFHKYNLLTNSWEEIKGEGSFVRPRFGHSAVTFDNSMYIFGGNDGIQCLEDFHQYSFQTNIWYELRRTQGDKPSARFRQEMIIVQQKLYLFGGEDQNQIKYNDIYQFSFYLREWKKLNTTGQKPSPRSFLQMVSYQNSIIIYGGYDGKRTNDMFILILGNNDKIIQYNDQNNISQKISSSETQSLISLTNFSQEVKEENQSIIKKLNEKLRELSSKLALEEERNLCKICFSKEIDSVILECCHFVLCFSCASSVEKCPICRSTIQQVIQTHNY